MKKILFSLLVLASFSTFGQITFNTGDAGFDAELNVINKEATKDLVTFKNNLSTEFGVTVAKIEGLLKEMNPAEALLSVKISSIAKQPLEKVVESYKSNKDKGWGYIAKEMGIKPGSAEFHALKGKKNNSAKPANGNSKGKGKGK